MTRWTTEDRSEYRSESRYTSAATTCVFLPNKTAEGYGQHAEHRDGRCHCHHLYKEKKEFGCQWFANWMQITDLAIARECRLIVVTKEDGTLGRSQEGEVEYLKSQDLSFYKITIQALCLCLIADLTGGEIRFTCIGMVLPPEIDDEYMAFGPGCEFWTKPSWSESDFDLSGLKLFGSDSENSCVT